MSSELNPRQRNAAELLARGDATQQAVGMKIGVRPETMTRWLKVPAFVAHLEAEREAIRQAIKAEGIANQQNRIDAINERWLKGQTVIAERAEAPEMQDVPGGKTGLLVRTYKQVGAGRDAQLVEEYSVDTPLLAELRAMEKQAAQELDQWPDGKSDGHSGGTSPVTIQIAALDYRASIAALAPTDAAAGPVGYRTAPVPYEGAGDGEALG